MAKYAKALVAAAGFLGVLITEGLVTGTAAHDVSVIIAAIDAVAVYAVPNSKTAQPPAGTQGTTQSVN